MAISGEGMASNWGFIDYTYRGGGEWDDPASGLPTRNRDHALASDQSPHNNNDLDKL